MTNEEKFYKDAETFRHRYAKAFQAANCEVEIEMSQKATGDYNFKTDECTGEKAYTFKVILAINPEHRIMLPVTAETLQFLVSLSDDKLLHKAERLIEAVPVPPPSVLALEEVKDACKNCFAKATDESWWSIQLDRNGDLGDYYRCNRCGRAVDTKRLV